MDRRARLACVPPTLALLGALALPTAPARAHETDQFTVPTHMQFADMGGYLSSLVYDTVGAAINRTNDRIRRTLGAERTASERRTLQSPDILAASVFSEFTSAYFIIEDLEAYVDAESTQRQYAGMIVGYEEQFRNIYEKVHFALDPRQFFRLWHASTLKVYGHYLGTDKVGHFTDMGYNYYKAYRKAIQAGLSEEEAVAKAVLVGTDGFLFAEEGMVGYLSAGAYSNADLASNYAGFKFYLNLADPVMIGDRELPPLCVLEDGLWRFSDHVLDDSEFFRPFITDHFNEALNPSLFEERMRDTVRMAIDERCSRLLEWYADDNGAHRPQAWFDDKMIELMTFCGEPYGHQGNAEDLLTINTVCFKELGDNDPVGARTTEGLGWMHVAARRGDTELGDRLLQGGANVNTPVQSDADYSSDWGNTPLHVAAAAGQESFVRLLASAGADVDAANGEGVRPLHRAIGHPEVVRLLIDEGADVTLADSSGRTPLHWAARYSVDETILLLIEAGADVDARDRRGQTPLHRAAGGDQANAIRALIDADATLDARADLQITPLHLAGQRNAANAIELLANAGAPIDAGDEFGWTPLHDAAARGATEAIRALVASGARPNVEDAHGSTPLLLAARHGHVRVSLALLDGGAAVNAANDGGSTPLHEAAFQAHLAVVKALLDRGADPQLADNDGRIARDFASMRGRERLSAILLTHEMSRVQ